MNGDTIEGMVDGAIVLVVIVMLLLVLVMRGPR